MQDSQISCLAQAGFAITILLAKRTRVNSWPTSTSSKELHMHGSEKELWGAKSLTDVLWCVFIVS